MSIQLSTYSGKDVNVSLFSPLTGLIQAAGIAEMGLAQISIRMTTAQSVLQVGMDGAVVPSVIPGDQGEIELQVWQTSTLQEQLLAWYNRLKSDRDAGDVSNWFGSTVAISCIVDGSTHIASGVAPLKVPDKVYQEQAQRVTWILVACNISSM